MTRIVDLDGGQLLRLDTAAGARVRVLFGAIWLTEPHRLDDVFAGSGDEVVLDYGTRVLLEAQGFARLIVVAPRSLPICAGLLARLRRRARHSLPTPAHSAV